jgi:hypothetical protein
MPVTIWRPVVVAGNHARARHPHPAVVVGIRPITISIEILRAPDVFVKILRIVFDELCELALTLVYPVVDGVVWSGGDQFPIAGIVSGRDENRRTTVTQSETGSV